MRINVALVTGIILLVSWTACFAQPTGGTEAQSPEEKNAALLDQIAGDPQLSKWLHKAQTGQGWQTFSHPMSYRQAVMALAGEHLSSISAVEDDRWKRLFPSVAYDYINKLIEARKEEWSKEYLDKVQGYTDAKAALDDFNDTWQSLTNSMGRYRLHKQRLQSIRSAYMYNLEGVSTTFLVFYVGRRNPADEHVSVDKFNSDLILASQRFVSTQANMKLIFSDSRLEGSSLVEDVISGYSGGRIEPFETDSVKWQKDTAFLGVRKFRVYPNFNRPSGESDVVKTVFHQEDDRLFVNIPIHEGGAKAKLEELWPQIRKLAKLEWTSPPPELLQYLIEESDAIRAEREQVLREKLMVFDKEYQESVAELIEKINAAQREMQDAHRRVQAAVKLVAPDYDMSKIEEYVTQVLYITSMEDIRNTALNKVQVEGLLKAIEEQYFRADKLKKAEQALMKTLATRTNFVVTEKQMVMSGYDTNYDSSDRVVEAALKDLETRVGSLVSYSFMTVDGTKDELITKDAAKYYGEARILRAFVLNPIHYADSSDKFWTKTYNNMTTVVALEVQYYHEGDGHDGVVKDPHDGGKTPPTVVSDRDTAGAKPEPKPEPKPETKPEPKKPVLTVFLDKETGLEWVVTPIMKPPATFDQCMKRLPSGYTVPRKAQILTLLDALGKGKGGDEFAWIKQAKGLFSSKEVNSPGGVKKRQVVYPNTRRSDYHKADYKAVLIGVRQIK